ncbi:MAG: zinc-ribbon domain-containing protein [Maritimibacter sp.]
MRLICPNCGAQYEVDDRVIPENGRDVQCSACGHGWYQMRKDLVVSSEEELDAGVAEPEAEPAPEAEPEPETAAAAESKPEAEFAPDLGDEAEEDTASDLDEPIVDAPEYDGEERFDEQPEPELEDEPVDQPAEEDEAAPDETPEDETAEIVTQDDAEPEGDAPDEVSQDEGDEELQNESDEDEDEETSTPIVPARPPRSIDEGIRSVLREEAQREMEARESERGRSPEPMEMQSDLGLDAGDSDAGDSSDEARRREARARMAKMRGLDDEPPEADFDMANEAPEPRAQGRDLFPDIEEINSTLDSHETSDAGGAEEDEEVSKRGFSRGFFLVIFLAALLLTLYLIAPQLAEKVPALKPALVVYVDMMNSLRAMLDTQLRSLIVKIKETTG